MIHLTLITVGTLKEDYLRKAVSEYNKRLSQYARVDEINIKEETIFNENDSTEIALALKREGEKILAAIPKESSVIALCVEGKLFDSLQLSSLIEKMQSETGKITLIIGSSHGMADTVKQRADLKLSLSPLTFPHQLMRVILLEVIYRSFTILAGKKYHK